MRLPLEFASLGTWISVPRMPTLSPANRTAPRHIPGTFAATYSAAFGLLMACCHAEGREDAGNVLDFLSTIIPHIRHWPRVFELGEHHGVLPAVHRVLRVDGRERFGKILPGEVREEFDLRSTRLVKKNLRIAAELIHILDCLDAAGVTAVPHKGPVLAETVYGDLALRDFSDLDVLVHAAEISRAKEALSKIGYKPNIELSPIEERAYLASGYEYTFDGPAGKNLLELQWNFVPRFFAVACDMEGVFARASTATVAGRAVRTLAPDDLFVALCVHAAKHLWGRLCWLRDIAVSAKRLPIDWERVRTESRRLGVERIVDVSLGLASTLLGAADKRTQRPGGEDSAEVRAIIAEVAQHIPNAEEYNAESVDYFRWMLRLRERPVDRWRFAGRLLFTPGPGEWALVKLPGALFPLYRGVRLLRVGGRLLGLR
jgi:hypothetical protein